MILAATTHTLEILLGGAVATSQCPVVVDYVDVVGDTITGGSKASLTNSTTPVTICDAPGAGHYVKVNGVTVPNIDTAAITAIVRFNNNGATFDLVRITIPVGATLQFTDRFGWQLITKQGGVPNLRAGWVQEFKESGTWYKPAGPRFFMVECVGGGGGGGSGQSGTALASKFGGSGAGGGCRVRRIFLASDLPSSVVITVATQANGGVGAVNGVGTSGSAGGPSSFGSYLVAYGGGGGGPGGNTTSPAGGAGGGGTATGETSVGSTGTVGGAAMRAGGGTGQDAADYRGSSGHNPSGASLGSFLGGGGGAAASSGAGSGGSGSGSFFSAGGGGSGGSVSSSGPTAAGAGGGGGSGTFLTVGTGTPIGGNGIPGVRVPGFCGSGGCGGGSLYLANGDVTGGKGGDGGWPGGGGGGGGAAATASGNATGGAGGKGGAGMVRVMGW